MRFGVRGAAALCVVGLFVAGCSGDDEPAADGPDSSVAPSGEPSAGAGITCSDGTGDSADPQFDLLAVRLSRSGKNVRVVFDETAPPLGSPLSWVVGFVAADGKHSVELTVDQKKNGDYSHAIVVDGEPAGVEDAVRLTAEGMTTTFPVKAIDELGKNVKWYATLGVDGEEIDFCPGGAELREVLDIVPLTLPATW